MRDLPDPETFPLENLVTHVIDSAGASEKQSTFYINFQKKTMSDGGTSRAMWVFNGDVTMV
jgi:hypothetical protein